MGEETANKENRWELGEPQSKTYEWELGGWRWGRQLGEEAWRWWRSRELGEKRRGWWRELGAASSLHWELGTR